MQSNGLPFCITYFRLKFHPNLVNQKPNDDAGSPQTTVAANPTRLHKLTLQSLPRAFVTANQPPFHCAKPHLCELCKDFFQHRKGTGENRGGCRVGFKHQGLRLLCVFLRHKPTAGHVWLRHVAAAAGKDADAR